MAHSHRCIGWPGPGGPWCSWATRLGAQRQEPSRMHVLVDLIASIVASGAAFIRCDARKGFNLAPSARLGGYKRTSAASVLGRPNFRGAAARFLKPSFSVLSPPRKQAKLCRRILSTIDTTPSCYRSHLPLYHISLDREGRVVGALYVCISRRCRHLRRWIGSDREEETASRTTSSTFC
jgi:hypothetical protein